MSDPSMLVASLLTGGQMSASPPPALPLAQIDNQPALLESTADEAFVVTQKIVPSVEVTSPEFSQRQLNPQTDRSQANRSEPIAPVLAPKTNKAVTQQLPTLPSALKNNSAVRLPSSGLQLYYQRLAALKAGKIYTRVPTDRFESSWLKARSKPTYEQWKTLLAKEATAIAAGQGSNPLTVLVGDSLSLWFPIEGLPADRFWLNQGISGDTSAGILRRLSAFSQTRPDAIYIMAGINDLRRGATDKTILDNYRQIIRRLRLSHPHSFAIVQSILPTRLAAIPNQRIRHLNQQLATIAQQEGANYLNLEAVFTDVTGNLPRELTTDGLHLSKRGYEVWQWALQQAEDSLAVPIP